MKKLIFILSLLIVSYMGYAQLSVKENITKVETIATARMGYISLKCRDNSRYYLVTNTTNKFDDPFLIYIGLDKESAILTLKDLINLSDTLEENATITIDNGGQECRITPGPMGALYYHMDNYAGYGSTMKGELTRFLNALQPQQ